MTTKTAHTFMSGWNGDCQHCGEMEMYHMTTKTAQTPGPWFAEQWDASGAITIFAKNTKWTSQEQRIAIVYTDWDETEGQASAELIVRACNSHAAMLEALKAMLEAYAPNANWSKPEQLHSAVRKAGEAIAQAEGKE